MTSPLDKLVVGQTYTLDELSELFGVPITEDSRIVVVPHAAKPTTYVDDPQPDGDPSMLGGIGCPLCDTLWASSESIDRHLDIVHHTTYDKATAYIDGPACRACGWAVAGWDTHYDACPDCGRGLDS